jgi:hypothetical protein
MAARDEGLPDPFKYLFPETDYLKLKVAGLQIR